MYTTYDFSLSHGSNKESFEWAKQILVVFAAFIEWYIDLN